MTLMARHPIPPGRGSIAGRTVLESKAVQVPDVLADPETSVRRRWARCTSVREMATKATARPSNGPNSLVELKKQLEERTRELAEARGHLSETLEQQSATSEVLRVISTSPGERPARNH